jgi:hypothetical protein
MLKGMPAMIVSGHMNFFDITACGLYRNGSDQSHGLELAETFDLIADWVSRTPMAGTLPWEGHKRPDGNKCYCYDFYKDEATNEYLFVLWKSGADSNGTLLGAEENATAGEGEVVEYTNEYRGKKVIWGRPCYYWVIPDKKTVISIKFEHSVCDSQLFQDWVSASITNRVRHPNKRKEHTESGHVRLYFTDKAQNSDVRFRYSFDMVLKSLDTASGKLSELAKNITHIIKRETIEVNVKDERTEWIKKFDKIPYLAPKLKSQKRQIEIRAEVRPTATELKEIIEGFARENRKAGDWDNVGFETEKGTVWVDRYRMKDDVNINYLSGVIPAADIYARLQVNRERYLAPLIKASKPARKRSGTI